MRDDPFHEPEVRHEYPVLRGARRSDVVIVGGGLTGVTCAAMLMGSGLQVTLLEAHTLGSGATRACTGKLTSQLGNVFKRCESAAGPETAMVLCRLAQLSVRGVRALIAKRGVACHLTSQDVRVFAQTPQEVTLLDALAKLERRLGLPVTLTEDGGDCPIPVETTLLLRDQALMDPLAYVSGLAEAAEKAGTAVYEHSPVTGISGTRAVTPEGHVDASVVVLCTGAPIGCKAMTLLPLMEQRVCQSRLMTGGAPFHDSHLSVSDQDLTMRPMLQGMLVVQDIGRAGDAGHDKRIQDFSRTVRSLLGDWREEDACIRQDVWSADGLPLIGAMDPKDGRVLMATGYSGWGLVGSYMAARLLTRQIIGRPLTEASLFLPFRHYPGKAAVLIKGSLRPGAAALGGLFRPFSPVCPHMGCRLRYNPDTRRWECPCHGSGFSILGEVLVGPAMDSASISRRQYPYE